ncbi:MAG: cyclic nucleotide-binding domain-containing protein [Spirochaetia bacterium]
MSPKAIGYKANSIIYFTGDNSDKIYILKAGKISLNYTDIETGQEIHDLIQTGEFFGVKSALGKYPREETAVVLQNAQVIMLSVPEFESLAMNNTRIIMKMLKVFSNQLRRIHKQVQNLISTGEQVNPEKGLYLIGEYYLKNKMYPQALYTFRRYLTYYPSGAHADQATKHKETAESFAQKYGSGEGPDIKGLKTSSGTGAKTKSQSQGKEMSPQAKKYYNAVSLFSQEKFAEALREFKAIADGDDNDEYVAKAEYEIGRCLFYMKRFELVIKHYTALIQKYPKHPDLQDILFIVGKSYHEKGDTDRAASFFKKIISMTDEDDSINRKAKRALKAVEGEAV